MKPIGDAHDHHDVGSTVDLHGRGATGSTASVSSAPNVLLTGGTVGDGNDGECSGGDHLAVANSDEDVHIADTDASDDDLILPSALEDGTTLGLQGFENFHSTRTTYETLVTVVLCKI